ncbi:PAAR domain-containing protein [Cupriavidus numazuensis]|uniref:PAAR domain-containing protein n=1 Tax=Cupriavidus numazuensis TaxID=221992 RepID=UPI001BAB2209|nr:PAAR domain-containing protein [Cupriavidus numazuensis]
MSGIIRKGDKNSHGGVVLTGSGTMEVDGIAVARKGDRVSCPTHGENVIIEGDGSFTDDGLPVSFHGHRAACGCTLISSSPDTGIA